MFKSLDPRVAAYIAERLVVDMVGDLPGLVRTTIGDDVGRPDLDLSLFETEDGRRDVCMVFVGPNEAAAKEADVLLCKAMLGRLDDISKTNPAATDAELPISYAVSILTCPPPDGVTRVRTLATQAEDNCGNVITTIDYQRTVYVG